MRCGLCGLLIPQAKRYYKQPTCKCFDLLIERLREAWKNDNPKHPTNRRGSNDKRQDSRQG